MSSGKGRTPARVSMLALLLGAGAWFLWMGCGSATSSNPATRAPDGGTDGGTTDGGTDGGTTDGGTDGGTTDGGTDGGTTDGGTDGGFTFGSAGPWPAGNVTYGAADGIAEVPVVGMSTDESQNLWVATHQALYLLKPGQTAFQRFDAVDGLHLQSNPVVYCENYGVHACPIDGAAVDPGISEIVGGGPDEVFVGYFGDDSGSGDDTDPGRHSGKIDRVQLLASGGLQVDRFDLASINHGMFYWHDRTIERMAFDHFIHAHSLYVGTNHGVDLILPDKFRLPAAGEWIDTVNQEWMGDHLHAMVCYHKTCTDESGERMGDWRGLSISANGDLWHAGRWTAGKIKWDPDPAHWVSRNGAAFSVAFGDPYPPFAPVFMPPQEGDAVNMSAVSEAPDGTVWFASRSPFGGTSVDARSYGVASFAHSAFTYYDPVSDLGMAEHGVIDLVVLPDGWIVLAGPATGLVFWNPVTGEKRPLRAGQGIPDDHVNRLELDTMVDPPTLHVSTNAGASAIRQLP